MQKTKPQEDFYKYVNQDWLSKNTIPEGYPSWGTFQVLGKKSNDDLEKIIKNLLSQKELTKENEFIVNLFNNYLNDEARNKDGINPIKPILEKIDQLNSKENLTDLFIELSKNWDIDFFHSKGVHAHLTDSDVRALEIGTMGLGMGEKEFYEDKHPRHTDIKNAYEKYVTDLIKASKINFKNQKMFNLIYNFELELSKEMFYQEELRNTKNIFNETTIKEFNKNYPFIDWEKYLTTLGYDKAKYVNVSQPKFFAKMQEIMETISLDDLKDLMKWHVVTSFSSILSIELYDISFEYSGAFNGVKLKRPAFERATRFTDGMLGELLSKEYVKENFSENAKQDVLEMVHKLIEKYKIRINNLDWMSPTTKQKAIEKLGTFIIKIGYPDKWEDFSDLEIKSYEQGGSLFANVLSIGQHYFKKEIADINKPVDRTEWGMYAQTVNAYYNPQANEICFPAAILQAPFYDEHQSRAANLGGIGTVIGHEVSHGFDDEGSQFDKDGNYNNWWLPEDYEQYSQRTKKLVEQYNKFEINGHHINGQLTLGENIGDLSGLEAALDIAKEETPNDLKDFFENYARTECYLITPEAINTRISTDPHSPGEFRINGIVINIDEFHDIYQTKPGDPMYKPVEDRIKVW